MALIVNWKLFRIETELLGRLDGFLVEAEDRIKRADDFHVAHRAVGIDHALEAHHALHLGAHGLGGVVRAHAADQPWRLDAVAGTVDTATSAAALSRAIP